MEVVKFCAAMGAQALSTEFLLDHVLVPRSAFASGKDDHSSRATGEFFRHLDAEPMLALRRSVKRVMDPFLPPTYGAFAR